MKKIILFVLINLLFTASAQGLSWAYPFVVWDGNVYEVTDEEVSENDIEKEIGQVKTIPNDMTGDYYGNASNAFPKGTKYYKINNSKTDLTIAVEVKKNHWNKAIYSHDAPFHWMNLLVKVLPFLGVGLVVFLLFVFLAKLKKKVTFKANI
ncbi:hypothetical protein FS935_18600 [Metabacillus litoralis]|uniref:DUF3592 domain-containing protein n=1 Tax=Metabacillus litoralis TaxID=152268 RepID=A0A5C6VND4_9BACI|nr:hypothetical protein [Metabacillus litoralis]TXC86056.1 hypothetical protein FS935_18600 [Metabacillus litoralis]